MVSLEFVASPVLQEVELLLCFNTLSNCLHSEFVGDRDNDLANCRIGFVARQIANKRAVNFQGIDWILFQMCQRGMPGSEIVEYQGYHICRPLPANEISPRALFVRRAGLPQVCTDFIGWQRSADVVSLEFVASPVLQEVELLLCFNTLSNCLHSEFVGDRDNDLANCRIGFVARQIANKRAVNFQGIDWILFQMCQRGMPGSEIVEYQSNVEAFESLKVGEPVLGTQ